MRHRFLLNWSLTVWLLISLLLLADKCQPQTDVDMVTDMYDDYYSSPEPEKKSDMTSSVKRTIMSGPMGKMSHKDMMKMMKMVMEDSIQDPVSMAPDESAAADSDDGPSEEMMTAMDEEPAAEETADESEAHAEPEGQKIIIVKEEEPPKKETMECKPTCKCKKEMVCKPKKCPKKKKKKKCKAKKCKKKPKCKCKKKCSKCKKCKKEKQMKIKKVKKKKEKKKKEKMKDIMKEFFKKKDKAKDKLMIFGLESQTGTNSQFADFNPPIVQQFVQQQTQPASNQLQASSVQVGQVLQPLMPAMSPFDPQPSGGPFGPPAMWGGVPAVVINAAPPPPPQPPTTAPVMVQQPVQQQPFRPVGRPGRLPSKTSSHMMLVEMRPKTMFHIAGITTGFRNLRQTALGLRPIG